MKHYRIATFSRIIAMTLIMATVHLAHATEPIAELYKARINTARNAYQTIKAQYLSSTAPIDSVYKWSLHLLDATCAGTKKAKDKEHAFDEHLQRMTELESIVAERVGSGLSPKFDHTSASYFTIEAKIWRTQLHRD